MSIEWLSSGLLDCTLCLKDITLCLIDSAIGLVNSLLGLVDSTLSLQRGVFDSTPTLNVFLYFYPHQIRAGGQTKEVTH